MSSIGVNDVGGMSLHSMVQLTPDDYVVLLCNSAFMSRYSETFVNFTVNFQINDARILPIIIPTEEQLIKAKQLVNQAIAIKKSERIGSQQEESIMKDVNAFVNELYAI